MLEAPSLLEVLAALVELLVCEEASNVCWAARWAPSVREELRVVNDAPVAISPIAMLFSVLRNQVQLLETLEGKS